MIDTNIHIVLYKLPGQAKGVEAYTNLNSAIDLMKQVLKEDGSEAEKFSVSSDDLRAFVNRTEKVGEHLG